VKISNKKKFFFASETNTFHISYVESKNVISIVQHNFLSLNVHFLQKKRAVVEARRAGN
jgi:hypothetical protein